MGRLQHSVAHHLKGFTVAPEDIVSIGGHRAPPTCLALADDGAFAYTGGKDCTVVQYDVAQEKQSWKIKGNSHKKSEKDICSDHVLAVAVSSDGNLLASAGKDKTLRVYDTRSRALLSTFKGHAGIITSLAFRKNSHTLYSGSTDRVVKSWNLDDMCYIESLYGHQDSVLAVDALNKENLISCGSDKSVRLWRINTETQLVFEGLKSSADCVKMLNEDTFFSGGDDGAVCLWNVNKRKPVARIWDVHGQGNWINAVGAMAGTDVVATGSWNGVVKVWKATYNRQSSGTISYLTEFAIPGHVNAIALHRTANIMVCAVGQEHRMGRWNPIGGVQNGLRILRLPALHDK
jgi:ribosomal RNA-processing protein 9